MLQSRYVYIMRYVVPLSSVTAYRTGLNLSLHVTEIPSKYVADSLTFSHFLTSHFRVTVKRGNGLPRFVDACISRH